MARSWQLTYVDVDMKEVNTIVLADTADEAEKKASKIKGYAFLWNTAEEVTAGE